MPMIDHVRLMARYNAWMNEKVYAAASGLPAGAVSENRGAFFGSILGTLNHLLVADLIWMGRLAQHPKAGALADAIANEPRPTALDQVLHHDLAAMVPVRQRLDAALQAFAAALDEDDLAVLVTYRRVDGEPQKRPLGPILSHLFNHQTHHRGQITTLFAQAGADVGVTDVLVLTDSLA